jgi:hypothetical protein
MGTERGLVGYHATVISRTRYSHHFDMGDTVEVLSVYAPEEAGGWRVECQRRTAGKSAMCQTMSTDDLRIGAGLHDNDG